MSERDGGIVIRETQRLGETERQREIHKLKTQRQRRGDIERWRQNPREIDLFPK